MHKMKERAAQDDRTLSSWAYHVLRNAAIGNDENNNNKQKCLAGASVTSHKHQPEPVEEPRPPLFEKRSAEP
jgi:hypothetical protein